MSIFCSHLQIKPQINTKQKEKEKPKVMDKKSVQWKYCEVLRAWTNVPDVPEIITLNAPQKVKLDYLAWGIQ